MNLKQYNQHVFRKISSVKKSGEKNSGHPRKLSTKFSARTNHPRRLLRIADNPRDRSWAAKPDSFSKAFSASSARFDRNAATGTLRRLFPVDLVPCSRRSHKLRCCPRWACRSFLQASVASSWSGWLSIFFSSLFPLAFLPTSFH